MSEFWRRLLDVGGFLPRGTMGPGWSRELIVTHVAADLAICCAYALIPLLIAVVVLRRRQARIPPVWWLFLAFMLVGGAGYLLDALSFSWPAYRLGTALKVAMAIISWGTVIAIVPVVPPLLERTSPEELQHHIEHREQAEARLRESEAAYASLLESLPLNIFRKDLAGHILVANQRFCDTIGHTQADVKGRTDHDLFPSAQADKYRGDDEQVIATGEVLEAVEEHVRPDGSRIHVQVFKAPVRNAAGEIVGTQGMFWDVTQRVLADESARRSDARVRKLVHSNLIGVMVANLDGRILDANDAFLQIVGFTRDDLASGRLRWDQITPPEHRPSDERAIQLLAETGTCPPWEKEYFHRLGHRVPVLLGVTMLDRSDRECICFVLDITERKRYELALTAALQQADAASQAKSQFLANMSHEVRTPMNAIIGLTELVLKSSLMPKQADYLKLVLQSAESLLAVINDVLDFSKVESGKLELQAEPFNVRECVGDAAKALALRAHDKRLELACDIRPDVPHWVRGDAGRLRQVLMNLIGNAVKFTPEGEVVCTVSVVERSPEAATLRFEVRDTGIGVPPHMLARIFEPFEQADSGATRQFGGTGLGLAIVRRLAELMGGGVGVQSEVNRGSTFWFTLPLQPCAAPPQEPPPLSQQAIRGLRALVVDDHATNRRIVGEMLRSWDVEPLACDSVSAAMTILHGERKSGQPIRLVVTDFNLPGDSGLALAQQLRDDPDLNAAVVLLSSGDQPDDARCRELGVAEALMKPVKQSELFDAITAALGLLPPPLVAAAPPLPAGDRPLRILLAEDSLVNQRLALGILESLGHHLEIVGNGRDAVERALSGRYDLVLMDVQMPEMDGLAATREIRRREQETGRHVPIVAMTAHALKGDRERCLEAGMDEYVPKPVRERELQAAMRKVLEGVEVPPADGSPPPSAAGVMDWDAALRVCNGDRVLLRDICEAFLEEYPQCLADIRSGLENRDGELLSRAAHTIKGAMRYFGATAVFDRAYVLEQMGAQRQMHEAPQALALLEQELAKLAPLLLNYLRGQGGPA